MQWLRSFFVLSNDHKKGIKNQDIQWLKDKTLLYGKRILCASPRGWLHHKLEKRLATYVNYMYNKKKFLLLLLGHTSSSISILAMPAELIVL